ncbi:hypothetical protein [Marinobacter sp. UBA2498]|uniref:hypothetical protein n=1 Tax=Marinobacter sp. UBA2498 TaxID=1946813 RepID=UPI00257E83ED|nr:hypothetical protein [Marinobacter sp. UBA2498]
MTKATQQLTIEDMNEILCTRAEEVFLLCMLITRRGLAHAFCSFSGHVSMLDSKVHPIDSRYKSDNYTESVAELRVWTSPEEHFNPEKEFNKSMEELNTYISYLNYIIEKGEPITTNNMAA